MGSCLLTNRSIIGQGYKYAYYQLDYIESSGSQYINTTYVVPARITGTSITMNFMLTDTNIDKALFGYYSSSTSQAIVKTGSSAFLSRYIYLYWRNEVIDTSDLGNLNLNQQYLFETNLSYWKRNMSIDDIKYVESNNSMVNGSHSVPMYLFAYNNNGTAAGFSTIRLYSASLYNISQGLSDDDELTLQYSWVPAIRSSDNKTGLWATNTSEFFPNEGSTEFSYGEILNGLGDLIQA